MTALFEKYISNIKTAIKEYRMAQACHLKEDKEVFLVIAALLALSED